MFSETKKPQKFSIMKKLLSLAIFLTFLFLSVFVPNASAAAKHEKRAGKAKKQHVVATVKHHKVRKQSHTTRRRNQATVHASKATAKSLYKTKTTVTIDPAKGNAHRKDPIAKVETTTTKVTVVEKKRNIFESFFHALASNDDSEYSTNETVVDRKIVSMPLSETRATHFGYHDKKDNGVGSPLLIPFYNPHMGVNTNNKLTLGVALPSEKLMPLFHINDYKWSSWQRVRDAGVELSRDDKKAVARIVDLGPGLECVAAGRGIDLTQKLSLELGGDGPLHYRIIPNYFKGKSFGLPIAYSPVKIFKKIHRHHRTLLASNR